MDTILGIDLGTTNSVVAVLENGRPKVLSEEGEMLLPSVVGLDRDGKLLVGLPARNQWTLAPERTIRSVKRKMGQDLSMPLGPQQYSPQEISAMILRTLKERAQRLLGQPVKKAVITVPAFFNEQQREATRQAGELAGLEVVRIINEPTAAVLNYEADLSKLERLLVYDLGGGTFDVSIVQVEQGVVEVLSSHGDTSLGGDDFDQLLLDFVADRFQAQHQLDLRPSLSSKSRLLRAVEEAKKELSTEPVVQLSEEFIAEKNGIPLHLNMELTRIDYESLIEPLLEKTLVCVAEALADARLQAPQIDKVILVGGASRTPMVHRLLQEQLGQPLHFEVDPDLAVATGAAIQGGMISGVEVGPVLVDITPHTLGIQVLDRDEFGMDSHFHFSPIIERNTPLPAVRSELYSTNYDGQKMVMISVYQGENDDVRENEFAGEFMLEGLSDRAAGNEIQVKFELNLDGILKVRAVERATGLHKELTIDNAMQRFRSQNQSAAMDRLNSAFGVVADDAPDKSPRSTPAAPASAGSQDYSPEWQERLDEAELLISRGKELAEKAHTDDVKEMNELSEKLRATIEKKNAGQYDVVSNQLEDLIFYLQDQ